MEEKQQKVYEEEDDVIDLGRLVLDYLRYLKHTWLILILLVVLGIGGAVAGQKVFYQPQYSARIYYSVDKINNTFADTYVAARLGKGISTMTGTIAFREDLRGAVEGDLLAGSYSFNGIVTESANLFDVVITSDSSEGTNQLLQAFMDVYPSWATKTIGSCKLTVTDYAENTGRASNAVSRKKVFGLGFLAGCFVWFLLASLRIFTSHKVMGKEDVEKIIDAKCLGLLPLVQKKKRQKSKAETLLIDHENIDSQYLSSVKVLRRNLEKEADEKQAKVFLLTSTLPSEGKSLITYNLALALAEHKKKVAVIDGDFRESGISRMLEFPEDQKGLTDFLQGKVKEAGDFILSKGRLKIVPAGTIHGDAASLVDARRMNAVMNALSKSADYVLIDTPPVHLFGDAAVFSEYADEVFYVIRGDYAEVKDVQKGIETFYQMDKFGGYILNQMQAMESDHHYMYGYGYGYSRYGKYGSYGHYGVREKTEE